MAQKKVKAKPITLPSADVEGIFTALVKTLDIVDLVALARRLYEFARSRMREP